MKSPKSQKGGLVRSLRKTIIKRIGKEFTTKDSVDKKSKNVYETDK